MNKDFEHRKCCFDNIDRLNRENAEFLHLINKQRKNLINHQYNFNKYAHDIVMLLNEILLNKDNDLLIKKELFLLDEYKKEKIAVSHIEDFINKYEHKITCNNKVIANLKEHLNIYE